MMKTTIVSAAGFDPQKAIDSGSINEQMHLMQDQG